MDMESPPPAWYPKMGMPDETYESFAQSSSGASGWEGIMCRSWDTKSGYMTVLCTTASCGVHRMVK